MTGSPLHYAAGGVDGDHSRRRSSVGQKRGRASSTVTTALSETTLERTSETLPALPTLPTLPTMPTMPTMPKPPLNGKDSNIQEHHKKIATLLAGQIFGEMAILRPEQLLRRNATVKCRDHFCELFRIHREQVVNTWLTYPTVRAHLLGLTDKRAKAHVKQVREAKNSCVQEAKRYWHKIIRAKTKHAMLKAKATIRIVGGSNKHHAED